MGLASLFIGFCGFSVATVGSGVTYPPEVHSEWLLATFASIAAMLFALWCSAPENVRWYGRVAHAGALAMGLLGLSIPIVSYYRSFQGLPWVPLVPFTVGLIYACWSFRQRWVALAVPVLAVWVLNRAFLPPGIRWLPAHQSNGGVTVSIAFLQRDESGLSIGMKVQAEPGHDLDRVDLEHLHMDGADPPVLFVRCKRGWVDPAAADSHRTEAGFSGTAYLPAWMKSLDLTVTVPEWPPQPSASVTLAIPSPSGAGKTISRETDGDGIHLTIEELRWEVNGARWPAPGRLTARIRCSGQAVDGLMLRALDDRGRPVEMNIRSSEGGDRTMTLEMDIGPIDYGARTLRIEAYGGSLMARYAHTFVFRGVPNRTLRP